MAEELQHLIDRIQKEAVQAAEDKAGHILSQAKEKAAAMVKDAEAKAKASLVKADKDAEAFTERSTKALEQAARDLLISVGQGVENILQDIVDESVDKALSLDVLKQMLVKMAEAYAQRQGDESRIELLIGEQDQKELIQFFADQYKAKMLHGVEVHVDSSVFKGFKVSFVDSHVYHDFTKEAIAESLVSFLRPQLAEIVHRVARNESQTDKNGGK
ncbi:MAG TPA: ATPase [Kiritimatiellia bacterium]|nr:ATPase [Kiritimatiellia bacterium]